jgi:hypothetical protein
MPDFTQIFDLPVGFRDSQGNIVMSIEEGGAESKHGHPCATIYLPFGDFLGGRNVPFGRKTANVGDLNLDLGAGSSQDRGVVVVNDDIGRGLDVRDGRERNIARFRGYDDPSHNFTEIHSALRVHKLFVPSGTKWRRVSL